MVTRRASLDVDGSPTTSDYHANMSDAAATDATEDAPPISAATRFLVALFLLLIVGGLIVGVFMVRTLVPTVGSDAAAARERLEAFVPTLAASLPEGFEPVSTLDWNLLYLVPMSGVWVEAGGGDSVISIVRLEGRMKDDPEVRERAVEALRDQAIGAGMVEKTEPMMAVVGAAERELKVLLVRDPQGGRRYRVVGVDVVGRGQDGSEYPLLIEIKRPAEDFNVEEVKTILRSL